MNPSDLDTPSETIRAEPRRFPVVSQLGLLIGLMLFLFAIAGATIPKFFSSLRNVATVPNQGQGRQLQELPPVASGPVAITTNEVTLTAQAAYVWDATTGEVLFEKNADEVLPLASITKLMTALVTHELVTDETAITIPGQAAAQESASGLKPGETYHANRLATLALVASANDAAYTLGTAVGSELGDQDPTAQFVTAMNIRAEELGLSSLSFNNTTGLDITTTKAGAYGSAKDVSRLLYHILSHYPDLLDPTTAASKRVYNEAGDFRDVENTNPLVQEIPNLLASKTGYTDLAGGNLTIAFDDGFNRPIIVTVLGSTHQGRFADVKALVNAVRSRTTQ